MRLCPLSVDDWGGGGIEFRLADIVIIIVAGTVFTCARLAIRLRLEIGFGTPINVTVQQVLVKVGNQDRDTAVFSAKATGLCNRGAGIVPVFDSPLFAIDRELNPLARESREAEHAGGEKAGVWGKQAVIRQQGLELSERGGVGDIVAKRVCIVHAEVCVIGRQEKAGHSLTLSI